MKPRGITLILALLLSLILNAGILILGIRLYQAQVLPLSQVAGNYHSTMLFTLDIAASESGSENPWKEDTLRVIDDESFTEPVGKSLEEMKELSEERVSKSLMTTQEKSDTRFLVNEERMVDAEGENIPKSAESALSSRQELEKSEVVTSPTILQPPLEMAKSERDNRREVTVENSSSIQGVAQSSRETVARSGDQFAADWAANIHSQIEGCYPESSKRRGEEGVVTLQIVKGSHDLSVVIVKSSGFKRLDRCAISAVEKLLKSVTAEDVPASVIQLKPIRFQLR